jgi:putative tryptophan/tyrosine transport system substrate-binding protein
MFQIRRREFLTVLGGAAIGGPRTSFAQTSSTKIFRLGTLSATGPIDEKAPFGVLLFKALEQRGYVVGKNMTLSARGAGGQVEKLGELLREMKADQAEAFVVTGFPATVAVGAGDPVATHLIDSLAHPGGNLTGISDNANTLSTKRLALIKQAVPNLKRVAMMWNRNDLGMSQRYESSAGAARSLGIAVQPLGVREPDDFNGVFEAMDKDPPDAILMVADSLTILNRKRVFDYAGAHRIPALYEYDFYVRDGGLMSYGPDLKESFERAADLTARIFAGARPGELPFEEPTRYLLVVNLKTAKATGIDLPSQFLALADEVIE